MHCHKTLTGLFEVTQCNVDGKIPYLTELGMKTSKDEHWNNNRELSLISDRCLKQRSDSPGKHKGLYSPAAARKLLIRQRGVTQDVNFEWWAKAGIAVVGTYWGGCREDGWCNMPSRRQSTSNSHSSGIESGTIISQSVCIRLHRAVAQFYEMQSADQKQ